MQIITKMLKFDTRGEIDIVDLSSKFEEYVRESKIKNGIIIANVIGSTGALTAIEYESRVLDDFRKILEKLVPKGAGYKHDLIDSNAHSHLRASIIGPSLAISIQDGRLQLGTWQQPVFVCLDVRSRSRKVAITVMGE
ncbi:MAG: secondary thiamine-phosphate synthase enzyme YjbQ [Candidatus Heimdallarchaeota archaeon]|nr:YjbQ family protein [Candidatus Heimdallarchaeota archaeon]MCK4955353.1 secondary thiamine-phosphate synthase enzyme YjbQ [Candidatus Heimdallarchaeota archaeon]